MNCKKCGAILAGNDQFCKNCGEMVNSQLNNVGVTSSVGVSNDKMYGQSNSSTGQLSGSTGQLNSSTGTGISGSTGQLSSSTGTGISGSTGQLSGSTGQYTNMQSMQSNYSNNINNNQSSWSNYNNTPMNNNQPMNKPSGNGKYIAIGLAIAIGICVVFFVIGMIINKGDNNSLTDGIAKTSSKSNYKVTVNGFTFEIPDNMAYEQEDDSLLISNEEGSWGAFLQIRQGSFAKFKANKSQLQTALLRNGTKSSAATEQTLGGVEFITFEMTKGGENAVGAIAKANSMYCIAITVMNNDNEYDYKLLEKIAPIISSVKYTGSTTNNINVSMNFDMSEIFALAK